MTWKCDESRSDEIGQLAGSLNEMSAQLSAALESLQSANEQLQSDIEKERRQERQRIDFFTSVSHELKTPITIIKGELEGMIYKVGEYKDRDAYLKHALKTVTDMEILVKDILSAARMGGSDFQLLREKVDMTHLVERCCRKVKGITEDKKIKMFSHLQQNVFYNGDERLLQQAVSNIINNAVIYSPEQAEVELSDAMLTVHNMGVHIKDEDLEQHRLTAGCLYKYAGAGGSESPQIRPVSLRASDIRYSMYSAFQDSRLVLNIQMRFRCNPPECPACSPSCNTHSKPCFCPALLCSNCGGTVSRPASDFLAVLSLLFSVWR